jgi:hypothetical protein
MNILRQALHADQEAMERVRSQPASEIGLCSVMPADILLVLQRRLTGSVTNEHLRAWADLVLWHDSYVNPGPSDDDAVADHYESMWDVLQQLELPAIHGPATDDRIIQHIASLKKLLAPE